MPPPPNYPVAAVGQPAYAPPPGQQTYAPPSGQPAYAARPSQQAYAPPPGQPAYAPPPGQPAYAPPPGQQAYAPSPPPDQGSSVGSLRQSYVGFLQAFRDPPEPDPSARPAYDARASVYPQQSLADMFRSSDSNQRPDPAGAGYPQQPALRGLRR